ncbi:uncharacterized protein LOC131025787 [Salvia miltiorrhiza]|uniref:uncharacterized protein LOC131025787 n=1 Tax=Salvia miltiorrhiza TaxID=226208 RepID=UPI0025ABD859|nr:uncharacterized protein LOC131025787 [Salvia miltiorrhiza]
MKWSRGSSFPTHLLYADDILVFCPANERNAQTIINILDYYGKISGQSFNPEKSQIFFSNKVPTFLRHSITRTLPFSVGNLPFIYLGVPIFKGKVRAAHLRSIHDKILNKFSRWKGLKLSMAGRLCLVKSVIQSSLTHSMMVYRWPRQLLHELDSKCRNFIWTGDTCKKPSCTVAWNRVCSIKTEGGLGVRSFSIMNKCFLMKIAWKIICGKDFGFDLIKDRYLNRFCRTKNLTTPSTLWMGIREEVGSLVDNSYSFIGDGSSTNFWTDDWLGYRLIDKCHVPHFMWNYLHYPVFDYFYDGVWHFTQDFINLYPHVVCDILLIPIGEDTDMRYWKHSLTGNVSSANAFANDCHKFPRVVWGTWLWESYIPVQRSLISWRIIHNRLPTLDRLIR